MNYTTIQIAPATREKLARLKSHERETYDDVLNALMEIVPSRDNEGEYTEEFKASLVRSISDIKRGRVHSLGEVRKALGV